MTGNTTPEEFVKSLRFIYEDVLKEMSAAEIQLLVDKEEGMPHEEAWQLLRDKHAELVASMQRQLSNRVKWYLTTGR